MIILIGKETKYDHWYKHVFVKNILILSLRHIFTINVYHLHYESVFF